MTTQLCGKINPIIKLSGKIDKARGSSKGDHIIAEYSTGVSYADIQVQVSEYEILDDYPTEEVNV